MLKLRSKDNKHNAVWLVEPKVTVGRLSSNDLVVDDSSVAEQQLEIQVDHEELTLINVSPEQAVLVNGEAVSEPRPLQINDVITIGHSELVVVDPKTDTKNLSQQSTMVRGGATVWALKANHSSLSNRVFPLKPNTIVGRSSECDISLGAAHLSRRHAQLQVLNGLLYVKDLGSANGTYINGKKISEARVKRGDELRFDTLSFGVIGPADDIDRTTVRSRGAPGVPSRPDVRPEARPTAEAGVRQRQDISRPGVKRPVREVVQARHSVTNLPAVSAGGRGRWILLGLVGLVVLAAVFAGMQFL